MSRNLNRLFFLALAGCFILGAVQAQHYPYEWISLGMSEDPATIQRVRWRTAHELPVATAQYTLAVATPDLEQATVTVPVASSLEDDHGSVRVYHHATFAGLRPDTKYLYRVGDGGEKWSEWFQFKTAQDKPQPFSFYYISDVQKGIDKHYPRVVRQAIMTAPEAEFFLFTGDMTGGSSEWEWNEFFKAHGWIFAMKPVTATPDNHEYRWNEAQKNSYLTSYWPHLFSYPDGTTPQHLVDLGNYYYDYQGCRFIFFNTKELRDRDADYKKEIVEWVEGLLRNNPNKWTVMAHHRPMYSMAEGRADDYIEVLFKQIYEKYDVDLVLQGHDHVYSRTRAKQTERKSKKLTGPVYVVSVAGSQMYVPDYHTFTERLGANQQLFQVIHIDDRTLNFKAYDATGELYDEFVLTKKKGVKRFTDRGKHIPEKLDFPPQRRDRYNAGEWEEVEQRRKAYEASR